LYHQLVDLNGHVNSLELNPTLVLHPLSQLTLTTDWDFFWRESAGDGLYNVGGFFIRNGRRSRARYIGSQPSLIAEWRIQRHVTAVVIYTHFTPGPFLQQTGPARTVNYGSMWFDYKF
jgi:Alginate export